MKKPKIKKHITFSATSEEHGISAHGKTEKQAIKLLDEAIAAKEAAK